MSFEQSQSMKVGDITIWKSGGTPSKAHDEYWNGAIPWISAKTFNNSKIYDSETRITELGLANGSRLAEVDSILLLVRGSGLFNDIPIGIVTKPVAFNQDIKAITVKKDLILPEYFLYWLIANKPLLNNLLEFTGIGAGKFDIDTIKNLDIDIPPFNYQKKIVEYISALDEKIELNRQTNATLEAIAQAIFKEWFVHYNYPGATGELVDSELGPIPAGWQIVSFEEELEAMRGLSYRGSGLEEGDATPMHNLNSVYEGGGYKFEGIKYYSGDYKEKHTVKPGDLIIANTEQGHKFLLIGYPAIVPSLFGKTGIYSHHIYRVRPRPHSFLTPDFLYFLLLQPIIRDQVTGFANGTTVNMLKIAGLQMPKFALPPKELIDRFTQIASAVRLQQEEMVKESTTLAQIRDTLLPKLMRGEVVV